MRCSPAASACAARPSTRSAAPRSAGRAPPASTSTRPGPRPRRPAHAREPRPRPQAGRAARHGPRLRSREAAHRRSLPARARRPAARVGGPAPPAAGSGGIGNTPTAADRLGQSRRRARRSTARRSFSAGPRTVRGAVGRHHAEHPRPRDGDAAEARDNALVAVWQDAVLGLPASSPRSTAGRRAARSGCGGRYTTRDSSPLGQSPRAGPRRAPRYLPRRSTCGPCDAAVEGGSASRSRSADCGPAGAGEAHPRPGADKERC